MDNVVWLKNGEQIDLENNRNFSFRQIITDPVQASYSHILSSEDMSNFFGSFMCQLMDSDGNVVSRSLKIKGTMK